MLAIQCHPTLPKKVLSEQVTSGCSVPVNECDKYLGHIKEILYDSRAYRFPGLCHARLLAVNLLTKSSGQQEKHVTTHFEFAEPVTA